MRLRSAKRAPERGNCYRLAARLTHGIRGRSPNSFSRTLLEFGLRPCILAGTVCAVIADNERNPMGPAIALRLRQHLTLTPQVQRALKLLQMSALEFAQEMEQALAANPFLEENPEAPTPAPRDGATMEDVIVPHEPAPGAALERDQEDWGGLNDSAPTLQQHLREQLMISPMGS